MSVPKIMTRVPPPSGPRDGENDVSFHNLMYENVALIVVYVFPFMVNDILEGKKAFLTNAGGKREKLVE